MEFVVGAGVLDSPSAKRQFGTQRENLPIEVKFSRRVVEDADPYGWMCRLIHQRHGEGKLGLAVPAGDGDVLAVGADQGFDDVKA